MVQQHGGFDAAVAKKRWGKIAKRMGVDMAAITNAGFVLRWAALQSLSLPSIPVQQCALHDD